MKRPETAPPDRPASPKFSHSSLGLHKGSFRAMFQTLLLVLSGNAGASLLSLLRNLLIARLLPVEEYGIAATFAIAVSVVEMLSAFGLQQQIVQSKGGDAPRFQAVLQGFHFTRGVIAGACLFFAAGWIAAFLNIPDVAWGYQVIALVPVLLGLTHYDIYRLKRQMRFRAEILSLIVPHAVVLAAVWPLSIWLPDYRLMLAVIVGHAALTAVMSHLVAERPYRLAFDRTVIAEAVRFGWPLLVNNLLLFLVFNGEKLIVGRELGMVALGILAMGFTLTLTPTLVISKSLSSLFLPKLSALFHTTNRPKEAFQRGAHMVVEAYVMAALAYACLTYLLAPSIVALILDNRYSALNDIIFLLALVQGMRMLKAAGGIVSMACGFTANAMLANLPRVLSLGVVWLMLIAGSELEEILYVSLAGELTGVIVSLGLMSRQAKVSLRGVMLPLFVCALFVASAITATYLQIDGMTFSSDMSATAYIVLGFYFTLFSCAVLTSRNLRSYLVVSARRNRL